MIAAMTDPTIPVYHEFFLPALRAVDDLGGSGSISEIVDAVIKAQGYTEEQQAVLHKNGPDTEIGYQLACARTYLKYFKLLSNSERGVWAITEEGTRFLHDPTSTDEQRERKLQEFRAAHVKAAAIIIVTGRIGDQGIDCIGTYRLGLLTFPVFFQCKRYTKSVGPGEVRDFRGAMAGRGEKGLLITTGTFTAEAKKEANRDGATPIELIDGDKLCDLLQQYDLGVRTTKQVVEDVKVVPEFFQDM